MLHHNFAMTDNFTLEELTRSSFASKHKINNTLPFNMYTNLIELCKKLEEIRAFFGDYQIFVTSGYRSTLLNKMVGGVPNSAHTRALAADFYINNDVKNVLNFKKIAESDIQFDQLICYDNFIHIGIDKEFRREIIYSNSR